MVIKRFAIPPLSEEMGLSGSFLRKKHDIVNEKHSHESLKGINFHLSHLIVFQEVILMPDELKKTIQSLQCRDEYLPESIDSNILTEILECVRITPSTANLQPWEIVVVTDPEMRAKLDGTLLDPMLREDDELHQDWLVKAPLILVVCVDSRRAKVRFGERGMDFALMDVGAAIMSLMLAAENHSVKGCNVREFNQEKVRTLLEIPKTVIPVMLVPLGYSNQEKAPGPTLELEDFVHRETWNGEW